MDRTTKLLLAAIALGLWANAAPNIIRQAHAGGYSICLSNELCLASINGWLSSIDSRLSHIEYK